MENALRDSFLTSSLSPWSTLLSEATPIKTVNLKIGMPTVSEAMQHLDRDRARTADGMRSFKADPRIWIERGWGRNSHRGAETPGREGQSRPDSRLHFRRGLVQIRRTSVGAHQRPARTETGRRSGPAQPGNHDRRAVISGESRTELSSFHQRRHAE